MSQESYVTNFFNVSLSFLFSKKDGQIFSLFCLSGMACAEDEYTELERKLIDYKLNAVLIKRICMGSGLEHRPVATL